MKRVALLFIMTTLFLTGCIFQEDSRVNNREIDMIQAIADYNNYFFSDDGKLSGLSSTGQIEITVVDDDGESVIINDFFTKNGDLYFHIKETDDDGEVQDNYFKQSDGVVTELNDTDMPDKPTISRSVMNNGTFSIENFTYEDELCSDARNLAMESGIERMKMIDGYSYFENYGMFMNVSDGRYNDVITVRQNGLYFWSVDNKTPKKIDGDGNIW